MAARSTQIKRVFDTGFSHSQSVGELSGSFPSPRLNDRHLVSQLGSYAPAHSFAGARPQSARPGGGPCTPGPNAFMPNANAVRPTSARYSIAAKTQRKDAVVTPGPSSYAPSEPYRAMKLPCTMKHRSSKSEQGTAPGPQDYTPRTDYTLSRAPSMPMTKAKRRGLAAANAAETPGPLTYNVKKDFGMRSSRSSTMSSRMRRREKHVTPGPGQYFGDVVPRGSSARLRSRQPTRARQQSTTVAQQQQNAKPHGTRACAIGQRLDSKRRDMGNATVYNLQRQWGRIYCGRNQTPHCSARADDSSVSETAAKALKVTQKYLSRRKPFVRKLKPE